MAMKGVPTGPRRRATMDQWLIEITTRNGNGFVKSNAQVPRVIGDFLRTLGFHMRELDETDLKLLKELADLMQARSDQRYRARKLKP
jgi:hypothetical protein